MKIYIIILLIVVFLSSAFALDVSELNGTNGMTILDTDRERLGQYGVSFINDINNDKCNEWCVSGRTNLDYWYADLYFSDTNNIVSFFDGSSFDSTNGYTIIGPIGKINGPSKKLNGSYLLCSSYYGLGQEYGTGCCTLLKIKYPGIKNEIITTSEFWDVSCRWYSLDYPPSLKSECGGNFISTNNLSICYRSNEGIVIFAIDQLTNSAFVVSNSNISVVFQGSGVVGYDMSNIGDTNGDGYDDLLVGSFENSKCWLVFGGRDWSGEVQLNDIGTNGVILSSLSLSHPVADLGDLNDDGLQDFAYCDGKYIDGEGYYYHVAVVYGKTNWPTHFDSNNSNGKDGFIIDTGELGFIIEIAGNGDVNGDGHEDILLIDYIGDVYIVYGGPFIKTNFNHITVRRFNETNCFKINGLGFDYSNEPGWANADINGDANGDGFDDILLGVGASSRPTNYAYLVYGGQSPSAPPSLRTPLWINVGESNSLIYELDTIPTNITWTGCKKGDDYTLCYTNGARCSAWDIPMGKLWFTNSYTISSTDKIISVSYTSTNALGPAIGFTTLTIEPVPEPVTTGLVVLTTALIGKAILK